MVRDALSITRRPVAVEPVKEMTSMEPRSSISCSNWYPFHDQTIMVTGCGRICFRGTQGEPQSCLRRPERRRDAGR